MITLTPSSLSKLMSQDFPDDPTKPISPSAATVRIDAELLRMARIICAHTPGRGGRTLKLGDYIESLVRKPITERYEQVMAGIVAQQTAQQKGAKKKPSE